MHQLECLGDVHVLQYANILSPGQLRNICQISEGKTFLLKDDQHPKTHAGNHWRRRASLYVSAMSSQTFA